MGLNLMNWREVAEFPPPVQLSLKCSLIYSSWNLLPVYFINVPTDQILWVEKSLNYLHQATTGLNPESSIQIEDSSGYRLIGEWIAESGFEMVVSICSDHSPI